MRRAAAFCNICKCTQIVVMSDANCNEVSQGTEELGLNAQC